MIEFELDGKAVKGEQGATVLEVALREGKYIPHFCYHKKLSIAANCRMCLVEVEKARGPVPACATPITEGMKVMTASKMAVEAQKGVMEFLLINHPLDCPICDQGGECQLQDLAVGYGRSESRFHEEKRAVTDKDLGPLVRTKMTRCIHCSRCVRFTDEIAGYQELGMSYRNNHVEVMPFLGKTVDSELSGNIIDICPVGALTSKPFQDTARTWELSRRKTIAPHDALGSNLVAQIDKYHKVVRVLPYENEDINECWISDRDRYSYEGLYHEERATNPMIKQDGKWIKVDWETAIDYAAKSMAGVKHDHGSDAIGVLASAISTTEELHLLQKAMRGIGVSNLDYRLDMIDFNLDGKVEGTSYLGSSVNELASSKSVLVVGSVLREEQPLIAQRLRQAAKKGTELHTINVIKEDLLAKVMTQSVVDPRKLSYKLAQVLKYVIEITGKSTEINLTNVDTCSKAKQIAESLVKNQGTIILGRVARTLPDYSKVVILAQEIANLTGGHYGFLPSLANEVGAQLVGFTPYRAAFNGYNAKGLNAREMLESPRKGYVLFNTELELDSFSSQAAIAALSKAESVIAMTAYISEDMLQYADVILPVTPFTETAGSYVNMEGKWQKFNGVTRPMGEAKPAWKVIRVLANKFNLDGFDHNSIEDVRSEIANLNDTASYLNNKVKVEPVSINKPDLNGLVRFAVTGIYNADSITRRANALQQTPWAKLPTLTVSPVLAEKLSFKADANVTVKQSHAQKQFNLAVCETIPETMVLLAKNQSTIGFAGTYDPIELSLA